MRPRPGLEGDGVPSAAVVAPGVGSAVGREDGAGAGDEAERPADDDAGWGDAVLQPDRTSRTSAISAGGRAARTATDPR
jgi:hypothetical protein